MVRKLGSRGARARRHRGGRAGRPSTFPGLAASTDAPGVGATLADRIAIEDMVTRYYATSASRTRPTSFGAFYTEDAVFDVNGIVSTGREAIEALLRSSAEEADAPATAGHLHMMHQQPGDRRERRHRHRRSSCGPE
jgi:hypothetical protein